MKKLNLETLVLETVAGTGTQASTDGSALTEAAFDEPHNLAVDADWNLYISEP